MTPRLSDSPHTVMWEGLAERSLEHAQLRYGESALELAGTMLAFDDRVPMRVDYRIACNSEWVTREVVVSVCRNASYV